MSAPEARARPSDSLELGPRARVLFSDRAHGNLSSVGGAGAEGGALARERLRALTGTRALARGYQVHGVHIELVERVPVGEAPGARPAQADGQLTALPGVGVMVLGADCLPVALASESAVAMVHAGWRGLAEGVLEESVAALAGLAPGEPIAAIVGPGAGGCCYEVGPEVHAALGLEAAEPGRIDLRGIAARRLLAAGVARVEHVPACTICDERFFSHRREGARAGRQGGVAWLS